MKYGLSEKRIEELQAIFAAHPAVESVVIFGSRARGNFRPGSDIDFAVKGEALTEREFLAIFWEIDDLFLPQRVDLLEFEKINYEPLLVQIDRCGQVFYQKEPITKAA